MNEKYKDKNVKNTNYMYRLNLCLLSMMPKSASILMTPFTPGRAAVKQ